MGGICVPVVGVRIVGVRIVIAVRIAGRPARLDRRRAAQSRHLGRSDGRSRLGRRCVRPGGARLDRRAAEGDLVLVVGLRRRDIPAERLLRGTGRQTGQHDAAVVADQHRADGDVAVGPAMGVQHPQRRQYVGADLGGPEGIERALRQQGRKRAGHDQFAHDPERAGLGEHVEDLVEPGMVGDLGRRLRRLDGTPDRRVRGPSHGAPGDPPGRRDRTVAVEHLGVHHFGQRHLPHQDFLPAVGVERPGLDQFVLIGRGSGRR